jgi:hypothetical protein
VVAGALTVVEEPEGSVVAVATVVVVVGMVVVGDGSTAVVKFQSVCDQMPTNPLPAASRKAPESTRTK